MPAKFLLLVMLTVGLILTSCSDQTILEPKTTLQPASDGVAIRPIRDFLSNQGTYCLNEGAGGCDLFHPPVPNFLCWCDPGTDVMASVDYAAIADHWILDASSGQMSCGTNCRGQIIEVPQPDGTARISLIVETKGALSWAEKGMGGHVQFGAEAQEVVKGREPAIGQTRLEVEFSLPSPGLPIPDLVQMLYAPLEGQVVHAIKFHSRAEGMWHGKPAVLEVVQDGLSFNPSPGAPITGLPAEIKIYWIDRSGQNGPGQAVS